MTMMNGIVVVARIQNLPNWDILVVDPEESFLSINQVLNPGVYKLSSIQCCCQPNDELFETQSTYLCHTWYFKTGTKETKNFHSYDLARDV